MIRSMNDTVKPGAPQAHTRRRYNAPRRREAAQTTRRAIVAAATRLFVERGYAATNMAAIAEAAGVSHETVHATFGPKPALFRHLVELGGDVMWAMNSPQFDLLYVRDRGWTPEFFEHWLADTWKRLLLPA